MKTFRILYVLVLMMLSGSGCTRFLQIDLPVNQQTAETVFSDDDLADAGVRGIYRQSISRLFTQFTGGTTIFLGLAGDELSMAITTDATLLEFQHNDISPSNSRLKTAWGSLYNVIYHCNVTIEKLTNSISLTAETKKSLLAETRFLRALNYFYLVHLFGHVPLVEKSDYLTNARLSQSSYEDVLRFISSDLEQALDQLPEEYKLNERIRVNNWAVIALLARVYLYQDEFVKAEGLAKRMIGSSHHHLVHSDEVFLNSSAEAILQFSMGIPGSYNTYEGFELTNGTSLAPRYSVKQDLRGLFDVEDTRTSWFQESIIGDNTYYVAHKYKVRFGGLNDGKTEHQMILRLAEQYLILAEALIRQGRVEESVVALDAIRYRAGLSLLSESGKTYTEEELLDLVMLERRREFCFEMGHRWLDLHRMGKADDILGDIDYKDWQPGDRFFPIPLSELLLNPFLVQHDNYLKR